MPSFSDADRALLALAHTLKDSGYCFTTVTPATHARVNARPENAFARDLNGVFGWSRPCGRDVLPAELFELAQRAHILEEVAGGFRSRVRLSSLNGHLFIHSAFPTEEADAVFFGPDTYRYALALERLFESGATNVSRAVDIGTGAGPGAILTALQFPQAQVFGVDINPKALRLTRLNAELAGTGNVEARESNLLRDVDGEFDLIVANPPYLVDPSERAYRHGGGPLGAGLSLAILDAALEQLAPGGTLLLYTGAAMMECCDPFREEVERRLENARVSWDYSEMDPDVFGEELEGGAYAECDRIAAVVLRVTQEGGE